MWMKRPMKKKNGVRHDDDSEINFSSYCRILRIFGQLCRAFTLSLAPSCIESGSSRRKGTRAITILLPYDWRAVVAVWAKRFQASKPLSEAWWRQIMAVTIICIGKIPTNKVLK